MYLHALEKKRRKVHLFALRNQAHIRWPVNGCFPGPIYFDRRSPSKKLLLVGGSARVGGGGDTHWKEEILKNTHETEKLNERTRDEDAS